jgi:hypothetical protein
MTFETWLEKARAARAQMFEHEAEYFLFLVDSEATVPWKGAFSTFEQALEQYDLCTAERFTRFRDAIRVVPDRAQARRQGIDTFTRCARVADPAKRKLVLQEIDLRIEAHGGPLSPRESERVVQNIAPVERPARHVEKAMAAAKLEAENTALRKRVKQLEAENAELRGKLAQCERKKKSA